MKQNRIEKNVQEITVKLQMDRVNIMSEKYKGNGFERFSNDTVFQIDIAYFTKDAMPLMSGTTFQKMHLVNYIQGIDLDNDVNMIIDKPIVMISWFESSSHNTIYYTIEKDEILIQHSCEYSKEVFNSCIKEINNIMKCSSKP